MMGTRSLVRWTLILAFALGSISVALAATGPAIFPKVTGQNLNGTTLALPSDFQAPASFVAIAYTREQQAQIETWIPFIEEARRKHPSIGAYEVPVLPRAAVLFRSFIEGGMRKGIPDHDIRAITVTLYLDKRPFNAAMGITSEADITLLIVKPDGSILWRASGAYDSAKTTGLESVLAQLAS